MTKNSGHRNNQVVKGILKLIHFHLPKADQIFKFQPVLSAPKKRIQQAREHNNNDVDA